MRMLAIAFVLAFGIATVQAAEYAKAISIIEEEGQFLFTDGSSYYLFFKDGNFDSGPLTLSGRSIQGTWKQSSDYQFLIEGKWSWLNGAHSPNDKRRLVINIQPPFVYQPDESRNTFIPRHMTKPPRIYKCYFTIEELVKTGDKK